MNVKEYIGNFNRLYSEDMETELQTLFPDLDVTVMNAVIYNRFSIQYLYRNLNFENPNYIQTLVDDFLISRWAYLQGIRESLNVEFDPLSITSFTSKNILSGGGTETLSYNSTDTSSDNISNTGSSTSTGSEDTTKSSAAFDDNSLKVTDSNNGESTASSNSSSESDRDSSKSVDGESAKNITKDETATRTDTGYSNIDYHQAIRALYSTKEIDLVFAIISFIADAILLPEYDFSNADESYLYFDF